MTVQRLPDDIRLPAETCRLLGLCMRELGIVEGMQGTPDAELDAAAAWLLRQPAVRDPADTAPATARGGPADVDPGLRGAPSARLALAAFRPGEAGAGAALYSGACANCHGRDGAGSADGRYPSLYRNSAVGRRDPANLLAAVLWGVQRRTAAAEAWMPAFGQDAAVVAPLGDDEIAAIATYVRATFGDPEAAPVTAAGVAAARGAP